MKKTIALFILSLFLFFGCNRAPSSYANIEESKIRPFAIICEPPEALPGDTVLIHLMAWYPGGIVPSISWSVALDYGVDLYGNNFFEKRIVPLSGPLLVPSSDSLGLKFKFIVPKDVIQTSTQLQAAFQNGSGFDNRSLLATDSLLQYTPPLFLAESHKSKIPSFGTRIKLRAHMETDITIDITKLLTIRYTRKFDSLNANNNPAITWVAIISVKKSGVTNADSIYSYPHTTQYLYNSFHPSLVKDTVDIDEGYSYFIAADSGISLDTTTLQNYSYLSKDGSTKTAPEFYRYQFFYKNLDFNSSMETDSLIVFQEGGGPFGRGPVVNFLPPVDTKMRRFQFFVVVRDQRINDPLMCTGEAFKEVKGVFRYSEAYRKKHY